MDPNVVYQWMLNKGVSAAQARFELDLLQRQHGTTAERPTDTESDALVGNSITLTPTKPRNSFIMPKGWRASGNEVLNITFSVDAVTYDPLATVYLFNLLGHVEFGAGGGSHAVDIDVRQGTQLTLIGQQPRISVELENPTASGTPTSVKLTASIGSGTRAARAFNTRTYPPISVAPQLALWVKVPPYAYSFFPWCDDPGSLAPGASAIELWSYAGPCPYVTAAPYGPTPPVPLTGQKIGELNGSDFTGAHLGEGIKLPQSVGLITIKNLSVSAPVVWTPCFALSL